MITLRAEQMDCLAELVNVGVGRGASVLNSILQSHIRLQVPSVQLLTCEELRSELSTTGVERFAQVEFGFSGEFSGRAQMLFDRSDAEKLVSALTGAPQDDPHMDALGSDTLCEVGNVVLNALMGSISNMLNLYFVYTVPEYKEGNAEELATQFAEEAVFLYAHAWFEVEQLSVEGTLIVFLGVRALDNLLAALPCHETVS